MARALVVDGDLVRGSATREVVCELGLDVSLVLDAIEALEVLRQDERPALMVTELSLPRGDGFALVKRLRGLSGATITTRLVVLSSSREQRDRASTLRESLEIDAILSTAVSRVSLKRVLSGLVPADAHGVRNSRAPRSPRPTQALPTLSSLALDIGADFGLSGLQVATTGTPVSRCATALVASDRRVLGHLYIASGTRVIEREVLEVIAREMMREFEAARMGRAPGTLEAHL